MMKWTKCAIRFLRISRPGVRVPSIAPNNENPNLFSIGEGFGFFCFLWKWQFRLVPNGCVELLLRDGRKVSIDCTGVEDALDVTMAQRSELDYLIYNDPLGYADLILNGNPKEYLKNVTGSHGLEIWMYAGHYRFLRWWCPAFVIWCYPNNFNEIFILLQFSLRLFYLFHANLYAHG